MTETVIEGKELTKRFGDFTAVNRVSFDERAGEVLGYLGPNGSGKTTTIRMLLGLLLPSDGDAKVLGYDIRTQAESIRPLVGYMSQKFALYDELTMRENLDFYAGVYDVPRHERAGRIREVMEMLGLIERQHDRAGDLSGGWRQRLALGCALAHRPRLLFLDEPTSGVDPSARRAFWDLIYNLASSGTTIFVTTHYMDEAEHCHDLALIYRGRLIARGSPAQLRANMKLGSLVEVPVRDPLAALTPVESLPEVIRTSIFGDKLHALVWEAAEGQRAVEQRLAPRHLMTGQAQVVPIALEDLFTLVVEMDEAGRKARGDA